MLVSKALYHVTLRQGGKTTDLLSEAKDIEVSPSPVSAGDEGKHLCYSGINQLGKGETAAGVKCLEDALPSLNGTPQRKVLKIIAFQILAIYYCDLPKLSSYHRNAHQECRKLENRQLLVIPGIESAGMRVGEKGMTQVPLKVVVLSLVSEATERFIDDDTRRSIGNVAQEIAKDIEKRPVKSSLGLFTFQCYANIILQHALRKVTGDAVRVFKESTTSCHESELNQCKRAQSFQIARRESTINDRCSVLENTSSCHEAAHNPCKRAQSFQTVREKSKSANCASSAAQLGRSTKLSKEQHSSTADRYHSLGDKRHGNGDTSSAQQSPQRAIDNKKEMFREEHLNTADTYDSRRFTQHTQGNFSSALQSAQRTLSSRRKLFGEEHSSTADSYHLLGLTQHEQGDLSSALQSTQHSLDIRRKIFGEEHSSTADSYHSLGVTQHEQGDFSSALQSAQRALDIRLKLFGEEHPSTADSYHLLGVTQHEQGDFSLALQSKQRALDIRLKLFGEQHSSIVDSYHSLGDTQYAQGDLTSALKSTQRAIDIRLKLFEEQS